MNRIMLQKTATQPKNLDSYPARLKKPEYKIEIDWILVRIFVAPAHIGRVAENISYKKKEEMSNLLLCWLPQAESCNKTKYCFGSVLA